MNRSTRAYRAAARSEEHARALRAAALTKLGPTSEALHRQAQHHQNTAAQWHRTATEEAAKERAATVRCWCGRRVTPASLDGVHCTEHDAALTGTA